MKLISHGIGLTAEGIAAAKNSKKQKRQSNVAVLANAGENSTQREGVPESHDYSIDRKTIKAQEASLDTPGDDDDNDDDPPPAYDSSEEDDEADWALDDAADSDKGTSPTREGDSPLESIPSGDEGKKHYVDKIVRTFVSQHTLSSRPRSTGQLPCPVILPQRRPQNKSRGFVRAYAPVLADCGIDQAAFLQFLKSMHQASKVGYCLFARDRGDAC